MSLSLHHPKLDVQLISTVDGNVALQRTSRNAQQLVEQFHATVPVAPGAASRLVQNG
ncbi:ribonucleoside hydrolase RihC, partial [Staphylococcus pseudintermedius]